MVIYAKQIDSDLAGNGLSQDTDFTIKANTTNGVDIVGNLVRVKTNSIVDSYISASANIQLSKLEEAVIQADGGQNWTNNQSMNNNNLTNIGSLIWNSNPATAGSIRLGFSGGAIDDIWGRNAANTNDILVMSLTNTNDLYIGYDAKLPTRIDFYANTQITITNAAEITSSAVNILTQYLYFDNSSANIYFQQTTTTTDGATGHDFWMHAQDCTGTTSVGGSLKLRGGTGTSTNGYIQFDNAAFSNLGRISDAGFQIPGSVYRRVKKISNSDSPYTVANDDYIIECNVSSGVITIYLSASSSRYFVIKDISGNAGANNITVDANTVAGASIDGDTSYVMSTNYKAIMIHSDAAANYWIDCTYP